MKKTKFPKVKPKKDEVGPEYIRAYDQADIPKVDTEAGPGLENLRSAIHKDVDSLSALNVDEAKESPPG